MGKCLLGRGASGGPVGPSGHGQDFGLYPEHEGVARCDLYVKRLSQAAEHRTHSGSLGRGREANWRLLKVSSQERQRLQLEWW